MIPKGTDPNGIIFFEKKVPLGSVPFGTLFCLILQRFGVVVHGGITLPVEIL